MYDVKPNLLIGFHGCDESVANSLLNKPTKVKKSKNPYDWLGNGFYVWENNLERARIWSETKAKYNGIKNPAVIGVVYNLGNCFDLLDSKFINILSYYFDIMKTDFEKLNKELPINKDSKSDIFKDKLLRDLDCSVIEFMHYYNAENKNINEFDTVRGVFTEGGEAFPGSGISKKSHIQVCIRNLNCIKGFFKPRI